MLKQFLVAIAASLVIASSVQAKTAGDLTPAVLSDELSGYNGSVVCHTLGISAVVVADIARSANLSDPDKVEDSFTRLSEHIDDSMRPWNDKLPMDMGIMMASTRYVVDSPDLLRRVIESIQGAGDSRSASLKAFSALSAPCTLGDRSLQADEMKKGVVDAYMRHYAKPQ